MSPTVKNILKYLFFLGIGAGLLWMVFRNQDPEKMMRDLSDARWGWIGLSMLIGVLAVWLRAKRWQQLLEPMGYKPSALNSFCAVTIGYMVNYALPRAGELSRCAVLYKSDDIPAEKSLGTVVTERIIDLLILLLLVMLAFTLEYDRLIGMFRELNQSRSGGGWVPLLMNIFKFGSLLLLMALVFRKRIIQTRPYQKIKQVMLGFLDGLSSIRSVRNKPLFIIYSLGIWACYILMMYTSFFALSATSFLGIAQSITIQAVGTFGYVVPVPGGIGAFHFFTTKALGLFGVAENDGNIYATLVHESQLLLFVIGGLISLFIMNRKSVSA